MYRYDAHVLACTLKMYFRQLPTGLVPPELALQALKGVKGLRDKSSERVSQEQAVALLGMQCVCVSVCTYTWCVQGRG